MQNQVCFLIEQLQMHLKKLTLKLATIGRAKRGVSKPLPRDAERHVIRPRDANGHIIRSRNVQGNLILKNENNSPKNL